MTVDRSKFITKKPVEVEYATFRFLTFEEYIDCQESLSIISLSTLNIYYNYKKVSEKPTEEELIFLKDLKDRPLRENVLRDELFIYHYLNIIEKVVEFKEGYDIEYLFETDDRFMKMRKIIMDMNLAREEKAYYNEEMQKGIDLKKKFNSGKQGQSQSPEDIITSITALTSHTLEQVLSMSVYQAYNIYARVSAVENYRTGVQFATVDGDTSRIEAWDKHIDLLAEEKITDMSYSKFKNMSF